MIFLSKNVLYYEVEKAMTIFLSFPNWGYCSAMRFAPTRNLGQLEIHFKVGTSVHTRDTLRELSVIWMANRTTHHNLTFFKVATCHRSHDRNFAQCSFQFHRVFISRTTICLKFVCVPFVTRRIITVEVGESYDVQGENHETGKIPS